VNRDEVHRSWTPPDDPWSPWVKPVLFAHLDERVEPEAARQPASWIASGIIEPLLADASSSATVHPYRADRRVRDTALVIDLAGAAGVDLGVDLVGHGFRPVPLYNAVPSTRAVVDLLPIMAALVRGAERVTSVVPGSPPAFLIDANRLTGWELPRPGMFDNRSVCRSSDFPSVTALTHAGIRRVLWVHDAERRPGDDLEVVLFAWQRQGLVLWRKSVVDTGVAQPFVLRRRWWPARALSAMRRSLLQRGADGSYGLLEFQASGG